MSKLRRVLAAVVLAGTGCRGGTADPGIPEPPAAPPVQAEVRPEPGPAAPGPRPIDLATALRLAAGRHFDVLDARARAREAGGIASAADGMLLPSILLGGNLGHTHGRVQGSFGNMRDVDFDTVNAAGTVRLATNLGEAIYRDLSARRGAEAAAGFERAAVQRTLLSTTLDYVGLVEADAVVAIQERFAAESRSLARLTRTRESQGLGSALDAERAESQASAAEQALIAARNERQRRSKALAAGLRLDPATDLEPVDRDLVPATLVDPGEPLERWLERAQAGRPEREALGRLREAAQESVSAARWSAYGPELSAFALAGTVGTNTGDLDDRNSWGVFLGWNFSFGGPGRVEAAEARAEQADLAVERFRTELQVAVARSHRELQLSAEALVPSARELESAEKALRIARASFEGGLLAETDLLLAQQAADRARMSRLAAVARYNRAQLRLIGEAGATTPGALGAPGERR